MDFKFEEYNSLIEDRNYRIREIRRLEILVIGAISSLYAWFFTTTSITSILWFLPVLLSLFGLYRTLMLKRSINLTVDYIRQIEKEMYKENGKLNGYETFRLIKGKSGVTKSSYIFWICLTAIALTISLVNVCERI